ncbi:MAG: TnpV protein [Synergistaceae bacterium]|nr:TnpV protein [Synergistaceae bacterium]
MMNGNSLTYRQMGDYWIPNLEMDERKEPEPLGKYALMRLEYLKNHRKGMYEALLLRGTLYSHLTETEETAKSRIEKDMRKMLEREPAPNKATDQMGWVRHMNMTKALAEERIMDLIHE